MINSMITFLARQYALETNYATLFLLADLRLLEPKVENVENTKMDAQSVRLIISTGTSTLLKIKLTQAEKQQFAAIKKNTARTKQR